MFCLDVKSESDNYILVTLCQNYTKQPFMTRLNLYRNGQFYKTYSICGPAVQAIFNLNIKSGSYMGHFELCSALNREEPVCIRVAYNHTL